MKPWRAISVLAGAALAVVGAAAASPGDSGSGRSFYLTGLGANGAAVQAAMGSPPTEVSAALVSCVNCHGSDGRGRAEGGLAPANIRWSELTKPYGTSKLGRSRGPYADETLIRAVTMGLDPAGHRLDPAMPRYRLTHADAQSLLAYLKVLESEADPGLSATVVRIGVMLPPPLALAAMRRAIRETVTASVRRVNEGGGIYGRKIELCFASSPEEPEARATAVREFLDREQPFALLSSFLAGDESEIVRCVEERAVPVIGPVALFSEERDPPDRHIFQLYAGMTGQGLALVKQAALLIPRHPGTLLLVRPEGDVEMGPVVARVRARAEEQVGTVREVSLRPSTAPDWASTLVGGVDAVLWLAPGAGLQDFAGAVVQAGGPPPLVLGPSALIGQEMLAMPATFSWRLFLSFPALATDQTAEGREEFLQLARAGQFTEGGLLTRVSTLAAAKVLLQALQQTGRELTRERLVEVLEGFYRFQTGQTPPVTFNRNRRIGADGAHVVGIDLKERKLIAPSTWVPVQ